MCSSVLLEVLLWSKHVLLRGLFVLQECCELIPCKVDCCIGSGALVWFMDCKCFFLLLVLLTFFCTWGVCKFVAFNLYRTRRPPGDFCNYICKKVWNVNLTRWTTKRQIFPLKNDLIVWLLMNFWRMKKVLWVVISYPRIFFPHFKMIWKNYTLKSWWYVPLGRKGCHFIFSYSFYTLRWFENHDDK